MSKVLVNNLNVRAGPSFNSEKLGTYNAGDIIKSGDLVFENEGCLWLRYTSGSGNKRYVCVCDKDGTKYVDIPDNIPRDRNFGGLCDKPINNSTSTSPPVSGTGIPGIPKQSKFPDKRIQRWGCCFLCVCVKGGLTTYDQCMDCFNWGINTGKLRPMDCWINCNKEEWAREISSRYGTPYHDDYCFQKTGHFWLTQNGKEIFNPFGLGWI